MRPGSRVIMIGTVVFLSGVALVLTPLVVSGAIGKYFVAAGFIIVCVGLSIILHALLDRVFKRR